MTEDSRRVWVRVIGRLGRETQLHLDERHRHFRITDAVIIVVSLIITVIAVFNVYYVYVLSQGFNDIVDSMVSMHDHLVVVDRDMISITEKIGDFTGHMEHMDSIEQNMSSLTDSMGSVTASMTSITGNMGLMEQEMLLMSAGMSNIEYRAGNMAGSVNVMRENTRQMARPMKMLP
ncbi:MAG: translation initiation factor 2 [Pseudomonadota bacterium]